MYDLHVEKAQNERQVSKELQIAQKELQDLKSSLEDALSKILKIQKSAPAIKSILRVLDSK